MFQVYLWIVLAPLIGALVAGLFGRVIGRGGRAPGDDRRGGGLHRALGRRVLRRGGGRQPRVRRHGVHLGRRRGALEIPIGFLIDELSVTMMAVVTFVSLMVHVYTIGYMRDDPGYQRFFSYISLFTFAMLMLVMSNNFMQLFFGWEAVGVVSYLLIGFWFDRESAIRANLKAFLVNRVGDFGFLLGIACLFTYFGSLHYAEVFAARAGAARRHDDRALGRRMAGAGGGLHLPLRRRDGQVRAVPAARLAAGFDGGADPDLGPHPRRHHGHRRHLHGGAHVAAVRALGGRPEPGAGGRRAHRPSSWGCWGWCSTTSSGWWRTRRSPSSAT